MLLDHRAHFSVVSGAIKSEPWLSHFVRNVITTINDNNIALFNVSISRFSKFRRQSEIDGYLSIHFRHKHANRGGQTTRFAWTKQCWNIRCCALWIFFCCLFPYEVYGGRTDQIATIVVSLGLPDVYNVIVYLIDTISW